MRILLILLALVTAFVIVSPHSALAADPLCESGGQLAGTEYCANQADSNENTIYTTIGTVIDVIATVGSVAAVIMVIIGGFRYVLSGGDSNAAGSARNTIIYSLVGLVVIIFARFIVAFILNRLA